MLVDGFFMGGSAGTDAEGQGCFCEDVLELVGLFYCQLGVLGGWL